MPRFPWQRQHDDTPDPRAIDTALDQFLSAKTWDATRAQLEAQSSILLSDAAIATLQRRIATRQTQPANAPGPAADLLTRHLHLLETARTQGIPATWDAFQSALRQEREDEIAALTSLLEHDPATVETLGMASDATEAQLHLAAATPDQQHHQENQQTLSVEEAQRAITDITFLAQKLGLTPNDAQLPIIQEQIRQALSRNQPPRATQGAPLTIPPSLQPLIDEITALGQPQDMPRKIALWQQAIQHIDAGEGDRLLWAAAQNDLGNALRQDPLGNQAKNLELAIAAFQAALQVYTREAFPVQWATTQNNLGTAWRGRILGDNAQNLELAIAAYQAALQVYTREAFPVQWAGTQNNLGNAWGDRILGDTAQNLELAIAAFQAALQVYTREAFPVQWATTQNNLGTAWRGRILGDNLELAIAAYQAALQVRTREAFPIGYRDTQDNLARAYEARGDWQQAHLAYRATREVQRDLVALATSEKTRTATIAAGAERDYYLRDVRVLARQDPPDLATMAEALEEGRAQSMRAALDLDAIDLRQIADPATHDRAETFIAARDAWRAAQQNMSFPIPGSLTPHDASVLTTQRSDAVQSAHHAFERARDAIRQYDNPDFLSPVSHLHDIAQAVTLPGNAPNEAVVYLVAGPEIGLALIILRDGRGNPQVRSVPLPQFTGEHVQALLQSKASHHDQELVCGGLAQAQMSWAYTNLQGWGASPREALASLSPSSGFAVALLRLQAAWRDAPKLLSLLEAPFKTLAHDERTENTLAGAFTDMLLRIELDRSLTALGDLGLTDLARELAALDIQRVALVPYGRLALFPLPAVLVSHEGQSKRLGDCFEVTIAPSARALTVAKSRAVEADRLRQQHAPEWQRHAILAAGNPRPLAWKGGNLPYAEAEADTIRKIAKGAGTPDDDVLKYTLEQATRKHVLAGLGRAWYAHLAMHGQYHQQEPRQSRIFLAGDQRDASERIITLAECLEGKVDLIGLRLLVLSACETSIIDIRRAADEVVGMASAFLQAGAAGVIASLWPVNDQATYLLMARFTNLYLDPRRNWTPAHCLAEAQRWLREDATNRLLQDLSFNPAAPIPLADEPLMPVTALPTLPRASKTEQPDEEALLAGIRKRSLRYTQSGALAQIHAEAARRDPDTLPYADPSYWAAFTVTGC